ncbi:MAG TPA: hypothetical protein VHM91_16180 [Verrucomicrobiales bacterium]|jgi:hypothetical protein|nr:hypothetical protein [Verrucomicrobiales bacterium]
MKIRHLCLLCASAALTSCVTTSLSDPNGNSHANDISLYQLTGDAPSGAGISEGQLASAARYGGQGSLPVRGARVLLVQSGAHQPDEQLIASFQRYCQPVLWDGRNPDSGSGTSTGEGKKGASTAVGRRLRLAAAQQGCSHVIVVFGEIQSDSKALPTAVVGWVPVVGELLPTEHSGTRLLAQAMIMETRSPRYILIHARPQETRGITTEAGSSGVNGRRSERLKARAYPELAAQSFRF